MLTIKHIAPDGSETVSEATDIVHEPAKQTDDTGVVWFTDPEGSLRRHALGGRVYVMNDQGATVAKYDLGGWAKPSTTQGEGQ